MEGLGRNHSGATAPCLFFAASLERVKVGIPDRRSALNDPGHRLLILINGNQFVFIDIDFVRSIDITNTPVKAGLYRLYWFDIA